MSDETPAIPVDTKPDDESKGGPLALNAGWRPIGGWICIASMAYALLLHPIATFAIDLVAILSKQAAPVLPQVDKTLLLEMISIFVVYRSFEKYNDVHTK